MIHRRLLIAEDDQRFRETLAVEFEERGYTVHQVGGLAEFAGVAAEPFDFAVVDLRLGGDNGLDLVDAIIRQRPSCRVVVLTGYGSIATAVKAVKLGAVNYLTKPAGFAMIEAALLNLTDGLGKDADGLRPPSLARHEREYVESVLSQCQGNISQAARVLGMHRQSLQRKLRKFTPFG